MSFWPYHFVSLNDDDKHLRRLVLNKYGFIAQLSAVAVIIAVTAWAWLLPQCRPRSAGSPDIAGPQRRKLYDEDDEGEAMEMQQQHVLSGKAEEEDEALDGDRTEREGLMEAENDDDEDGPSIAEDGLSNPLKSPSSDSAPASYERSRVSIWLDGAIAKGWKETRRQILSIFAWFLWLLVLVFRETGDDYFHLTKRPGQIVAALFPFHYLLGTPSPLSPLPLLFRTRSSAAYNAYHRLHVVALATLLALHAMLYLSFFAQSGLLGKRLRELDVIMGLCMVVTLAVIFITARQKVRAGDRRQVFVACHIIGAAALLAFLWFHVRYARWYVFEAGLVYVAGMFDRARRRIRQM